MRVLLAPMEGVLDALVRELLTEVNDYDLCITEFVRVVVWGDNQFWIVRSRLENPASLD